MKQQRRAARRRLRDAACSPSFDSAEGEWSDASARRDDAALAAEPATAASATTPTPKGARVGGGHFTPRRPSPAAVHLSAVANVHAAGSPKFDKAVRRTLSDFRLSGAGELRFPLDLGSRERRAIRAEAERMGLNEVPAGAGDGGGSPQLVLRDPSQAEQRGARADAARRDDAGLWHALFPTKSSRRASGARQRWRSESMSESLVAVCDACGYAKPASVTGPYHDGFPHFDAARTIPAAQPTFTCGRCERRGGGCRRSELADADAGPASA